MNPKYVHRTHMHMTYMKTFCSCTGMYKYPEEKLKYLRLCMHTSTNRNKKRSQIEVLTIVYVNQLEQKAKLTDNGRIRTYAGEPQQISNLPP